MTYRRLRILLLLGMLGPAGDAAHLEQCVIGAMTAHEINLDEGFERRIASGG